MMKKFCLLFIFVSMLLLTGCFFPVRLTRVIGSGDVVTEERNVSGFSAVELSGIGTLIIEQGNTETLEISAEDNLIPYLTSKVYGKNLKLGIQDNVSIDPREEITYYLTVKNLERIETSGLGNVEIAALETTSLDLEISGSGNVQMDDLKTGSLSLEVSGVGNVEMTGSVEEQHIDLSGAGNYEAGDLFSKNARIEISGTGKATIWVEDELDVELSGMGNLQYYGSPLLNTDMSGVGTIKQIGDK